MNRLTAYGSDSEGSDVESAPVVKTVASRPQAPRETVLPPKTDVFKSALDLPKATTTNQNLFKPKEDSENELESIVQRREWEIKLAEKEKKNFKRSKRKIDAFGGLSKNALEAVVEDDVIQVS
uniref:Uncharacterized protein n=1 Tax=Panagrolaimus sp. JU765 TaxID=591449 RepID=A0AC34R342_9BILA